MTLQVSATSFKFAVPEGVSVGGLAVELVEGLGRVRTLPAWRRAAGRIEEQEPVEVAPLRRPLPGYVVRCRRETIVQLRDLGARGSYEHRAFAYRCKSWRCRQCSRKLGARWFERISKSHIDEPIEWAFSLTYRIREGVSDPDELERAAGPAFAGVMRDLRRWLCRGPREVRLERKKLGLGQYLEVKEWTQRGYPHIHGLLKRLPLTVFFPGARLEQGMNNTRSWEEVPLSAELLNAALVKIAQAHGFGWHGKVERIRTAEAAASYVTSHALKAYQLRPDYVKGFRRITKSRVFMPPLPEKEPSGAVVTSKVALAPEKVMEKIAVEGGKVFDVCGDVIVDAQGLPEQLAVGNFTYEPGERIDKDTGEVLPSRFDLRRRVVAVPVPGVT